MKKILFAMLIACAITMPVHADEGEKLLGAIAGGVLGSTVGNGDGKKAATVVGAIVGYKYGERILQPNSNREVVYDNIYSSQSKMRAHCKNNVPAKYRINNSVMNSWITGCVLKMQEEQRQLEEEAFQDAVSR